MIKTVICAVYFFKNLITAILAIFHSPFFTKPVEIVTDPVEVSINIVLLQRNYLNKNSDFSKINNIVNERKK